jgi:FkbM family methyltransferase
MAEVIFDMGLHDGEDTAYYLASGYDVVAVDANPLKCEAAAGRFANEIAAGRLEIVNAAIAEALGVAEFWVSSRSDWSSLDHANATKQGATASLVTVPTMTFARLMSDHRPPVFVKIDLEGADSLCVRELSASASPPTYVSFEWVPDEAAANIEELVAAGYDGFKFVRQNDFREITPRNIDRHERIRAAIASLPLGAVPFKVCRGLYHRPRRIAGHRFARGGSGPLPWQLPGRWWSADESEAVFSRNLQDRLSLKWDAFSEWFDIHATRTDA